MDCFIARSMLTAVRVDPEELNDPEFAAAAEHVKTCTQCQATIRVDQEFDEEFARVCRDIRVPDGLRERLRSSLGLDVPAAVAAGKFANDRCGSDSAVLPKTSTPIMRSGFGSSRKRLMRSFAVAACLVLGLGLWWGLRPDLPRISTEKIIELATSAEFKLDSQPVLPNDSSPAPFPAQMTHPETLQGTPPRIFTDAAHEQKFGIVFGFQVPARPKVFEAILIILDKRFVALEDVAGVSNSFLKAQTDYKNGDAAKVWQEGDYVYVCIVKKKGAEGFDWLIRQPNAA